MADKLERLPRCCPSHDDWETLVEHLCRDFPAVSREQVLRNVLDAQAMTERFGQEKHAALDTGELIVRYQLLVSTGAIPDVARTDPQTHHVGGVVDDEAEHTTDSDEIPLHA